MRLLARVFAIALVVVALSALWWLETLRRQEPATRSDDEGVRVARSYFEDFRMRDHRGEGKPLHVVRGERLRHFADEETADVQAPRIDYTPPGAPPWHARAARGELERGSDRVELIDDVVLVREGATSEPLQLETTALTIRPSAGLAETSQPVRVRGTTWRSTAVGMRAHFDQGLVELRSDVWGRYEPDAPDNG